MAFVSGLSRITKISWAASQGLQFHDWMRVKPSTLLLLLLLSNFACGGNSERGVPNRNSPSTSPDQWQPYKSIPGGFRRNLIGDSGQPGPFTYQLKIPAGTRVAAHQHSMDVHVKVLSGSMFIIIGEPLESLRASRFVAGSVFVVPARAWHDEWWDEDTVLEAEGVGPQETVYKSHISRVDH